MSPIKEAITKAMQTAILLDSDAREAHKAVCARGSMLLDILLRDVIRDSWTIRTRLAEIDAATPEE